MIWNIVSDSSCDLRTSSFQSDRVLFHSVPLRIQVGDREFVDNDDLVVPEMLEAMAAEKSASSSACPSPADFARAFEAGDCTVCFTISSNLSGTYNAAVMARDLVLEEHPEKRICVIDSRATAGAMVLPDGRVITGKTSGTLGAAAALLLNALKALGNIDDQFELISKQVLEPVCHLKTTYLDHRNPRLHTDEVLMTLAISALTNPLADLAKRQLPGLRDSEAHFSVIISEEDLKIFKRLGVRVSCEPKYETKRLYHR